MHRTPLVFVASLPLIISACGDVALTDEPVAKGGGGEGGTVTTTATTTAMGGAGGSIEPQSCRAGTFATGFDEVGALQCASLDGLAGDAVNRTCSVYLSWRDSCDGCSTTPSKYGRAGGAQCETGAGSDNTCTTPDLAGTEVPLFGLNTDGDVNGDDKFYLGLHCASVFGETPSAGPCDADQRVVSAHGSQVECVNADQLLVDYVRSRCSLYFGWIDSCDGCSDPPSKWGRVRGIECVDGAGSDNTCGAPFVAGQWVPSFGLNTDGDVNGDDKFYVGLHCELAEDDAISVTGRCPIGYLVTGINADGSVVCCSSPTAVAQDVRAGCSLYWGWRDSCDGCTDAPTKWGHTSTTSCTLGAGDDSGCVDATLDGDALKLLGINTDGDVNGDDKFYAGLLCQ